MRHGQTIISIKKKKEYRAYDYEELAEFYKLQIGKEEDAISHFKKAAEIFGKKAESYYKKGNKERAIKYSKGVIEIYNELEDEQSLTGPFLKANNILQACEDEVLLLENLENLEALGNSDLDQGFLL